ETLMALRDQFPARYDGHDSTPRVIMLTAEIDRYEILRALTLGARGIVLKSHATEILLQAIAAVLSGDYWIENRRIVNLSEYLNDKRGDLHKNKFGLTDRELEVVSAIVEGYSNKEIARATESPKTP